MSRPRILVVEDDPGVATLLLTILEAAGFEAAVAEDGLIGLAELSIERPGLVLLDVMMPDVDGLRVLRQLVEEGGGTRPSVPVIVVTGSPVAAAEARDILDPADVLDKPFDPDVLLARVRAHLQPGGATS